MSRRTAHLVINPEDKDLLKAAGLTSPKNVMKYRPQSLAAMSGSSETFAVDIDSPSGKTVQVFVKRYRYRSWRARIEGMFRGTFLGRSRARFEFETLSEMNRRGVCVVRPMAYGELRKLGFLKACFLVTEGESNTKALDRLFDSTASKQSLTPELIAALGGHVRKMHDAGVVHGGLFARNILVNDIDKPEDGPSNDHACFLDPDRRGGFFSGSVPQQSLISDLSDLAASSASLRRTDLMRFARAYFNLEATSPKTNRLGRDEKQLLRRVIESAREKNKQERHRHAVGGAMAWLEARVAAQRSSNEATSIGSVEEFFSRLSSSSPAGATTNRTKKRIHFSVSETGNNSSADHKIGRASCRERV